MEAAIINPLHPTFCIEIKNVNLLKLFEQPSEITQNVAAIKQLLQAHKVIVFRDQGVLSGGEQISISQWFGKVEEAGFEQHAQSPDRRILRVSNDDSEGFVHFGTSGFHIDGTFLECPNKNSIYHIIETPKQGKTGFLDFNAAFHALPVTTQHRWARLWVLKTFKRTRGHSDEPGYVIHPLVYLHPETDKQTLCIHLGKTSRFLQDWGLSIACMKSKDETKAILDEIESAFNVDEGKFQYDHEWHSGDFIISDNLAVGHIARLETQLTPSEVGRRIMHRTVISGTYMPWSDPRRALEQFNTTSDDPVDMDDVDDEDKEKVLEYSSGDVIKMKKLAFALAT